jgi:hypothetical protein
MAILAGLNSTSVSRLKNTWKELTKGTIKKFEKLRVLMDTVMNFKPYRDAIQSCLSHKTHCIPFMGVFLKDIVFIEEGNQSDKVDSTTNTQTFNFSKRHLIAKTIQTIEDIKENSVKWYHDHCRHDNGILYFLENSMKDVLDEEVAYQFSCAIEPLRTTLAPPSTPTHFESPENS